VRGNDFEELTAWLDRERAMLRERLDALAELEASVNRYREVITARVGDPTAADPQSSGNGDAAGCSDPELRVCAYKHCGKAFAPIAPRGGREQVYCSIQCRRNAQVIRGRAQRKASPKPTTTQASQPEPAASATELEPIKEWPRPPREMGDGFRSARESVGSDPSALTPPTMPWEQHTTAS
jgi:hypothetical protein